MSESKYNNKVLLGILLALIALFFLTDLFRNRSRSTQQLPAMLIAFDTAQVTGLAISSSQGGDIELQRQGAGAWRITGGEKSFAANTQTVQRVLAELNGLEPERLVSRDPEAWARYSVNDSLATRVRISSGDGNTQELYIGRFNYQPPAGGMNPMQQQQQQISGTTYIRPGGEDAVYTTDGFLAMTVPTDLASWRVPDFLRADKSAIREVRFDYPDTEFTLNLSPEGWMLDGQPADSTAVDQYLNQFINRSNRQFSILEATGAPTQVITLRGENMQDLIVQAWPAGEGGYLLHSSLNPDAYFDSPADGLFGQLFVEREQFTGGGG